MNFRKLQAGLSIIELMVAMTISSFLIIGVTQIYIDNRHSYIFQQNQSENQEGSRFALLLLQQTLSKAGYRRDPSLDIEFAFPAATVSGCTFSAGQTVTLASATAICIRYHPRDTNERDCLGNTVTSANAPTMTTPYTPATEIFAEKISLTPAHELTCTRGSASGTLVSGIADLRFEYGVGSAANPQTIASYIKTTPNATQPVLAVRYSVLMRSSGDNLRGAVDVNTALTNWKALTGPSTTDVTAMNAADTGQLYQVSQNTVMLRNRMP